MQSDKENILLVDSVHLEFGQNQVLQSAYLTARTGRVTGVLGRNGTGKSCLFKCIMGGIKPQNMFIRFNDEMSTDYGHIGKRVKYLPQNLFMPSNMTLDEPFSNIAPNCVEKMQVLIQEQKKNKGIIVSDHLYEDILEVADDLFLLRDGYTFPIKSREDLIHHGYILR